MTGMFYGYGTSSVFNQDNTEDGILQMFSQLIECSKMLPFYQNIG